MRQQIAYFSMEIALDQAIPTYSGGLGVLAGDTLRSAADLRLALVGVTLLHRKGYFEQRLDASGNQFEDPETWNPEQSLQVLEPVVEVRIEGRPVRIRAWRFEIQGVTGGHTPVLLLDADIPENSPYDRTLTDSLYGGDERYRLCQEVILGIGGVRMLEALGYSIESYHMNEGHSSLLSLELLRRRLGNLPLATATEDDIQAVRTKCVFTTHTPVPAGHDQFARSLVDRVLGSEDAAILDVTRCCPDHALNMTFLGLRFSHYINGVAMQHGAVSRSMFPRYPINAITNGVHAVTWTSPPFRELYDRQIAGWRRDNVYLRYAKGIPLNEIRDAHASAKRTLLDRVKHLTGVSLENQVMTIGFARRATAYKRADLVFSNLDRLKQIARSVGPLQIVYGGKAHPRDEGGKAQIRRVFEAADALRGIIPVVYLEDYEMELAQMLSAGTDLWLNTPLRPQEASGTSGMKAALNGVPSFSVLDGWWIEGHIEGVTGWSIGNGHESPADASLESASLHDTLERVIVPLFYGRPTGYAEVMRSSIALNGAFFTTRMLQQYVTNAYPNGDVMATSQTKR